MPSMPARPITPAPTTTSARAATALPPIARMAVLRVPASPVRRCRRYRWAGCTASEADCFLLACGNLGGRRKTPAFSFQERSELKRLFLTLPLALAFLAPPALAALIFRVGDTVYVDGKQYS